MFCFIYASNIVWMGDLNYRIDASLDTFKTESVSAEWLLSLLPNDQVFLDQLAKISCCAKNNQGPFSKALWKVPFCFLPHTNLPPIRMLIIFRMN